jgi:hypothetical protein
MKIKPVLAEKPRKRNNMSISNNGDISSRTVTKAI